VTLRRDEIGYRRFEWIYDLHLQALVVHSGLFFVGRSFLKKQAIPSFAVPSNNYQAMSHHILQYQNPYHIVIEN
jgi:hypothetical protein